MKPTVNNNFYIYQHVDPRTNLIRYIGKGKGGRAWKLTNRSGHHKSWLQNLASVGLKPTVELIETNKTEQQAFELEKLWIAACRSSFQPLTNLTDGGEGTSGWSPSEEIRKKISKANSGEKHPNFGKHLSEATRRNISENHNRPMLGKTHNKQTRKKISQNHRRIWLGKGFSDEHRRKLSESKRGKPAPNRRAVIGTNLSTGDERIFQSATSAASYIKCSPGNISACCRRKVKQAKGWTFHYTKNKP